MYIISNGSPWAREAPVSVETLIQVLATEILDPRFEECGGFFFREPTGTFRAFGNFLTVSHVFNIRGTLDELLPLARAIKAARRHPEYLRNLASRRPRARKSQKFNEKTKGGEHDEKV